MGPAGKGYICQRGSQRPRAGIRFQTSYVVADKTSSTRNGEGKETGPSTGGSLIAEERSNRACQRQTSRFLLQSFGRSPDRSFRLPQVGSPTSLLIPGQEGQASSRDQRPSTALELQQDVRFSSSSVDSSSSGEDEGDQRSFDAQVTPFWTRSVWLQELQCSDVFASFQLTHSHLLKVDQPFFVCFYSTCMCLCKICEL